MLIQTHEQYFAVVLNEQVFSHGLKDVSFIVIPIFPASKSSQVGQNGK